MRPSLDDNRGLRASFTDRAFRRAALAGTALAPATAISALLVLSAATFHADEARALPQNGQVVAGDVTISAPSAKDLRINQASERAVIEWQSFNIDAGERVTIHQPSDLSELLNRVIGGGGSEILGDLLANGRVTLINPSGITIGKGARIDVGALTATTSDISNENFMAGRMIFDRPGEADAIIVNEGEVTAAEGGLVAFVAPGVVNKGRIRARLGRVALASGTKFTLDLYGDDLVSIAVDGDVLAGVLGVDGETLEALVEHSGVIEADGGIVEISAAAAKGVVDNLINMTGHVRATTVAEVGGEIVFGAPSGTVNIAGTVDATGNDAGEAGGTVKILGADVRVRAATAIDASGTAGGGEVLVGGNYQGLGPEPNAATTLVEAGATIRADASEAGDGGRVVVWADETTVYRGEISARGGPAGGDGGFVEVSGKQTLVFRGDVDASAPNGTLGTVLLDPDDIVIQDGGPIAGDSEISDDEILAGDGAGTFTISEVGLENLAASAAIVLEANNTITLENLTDGVLDLSDAASVRLEAVNTITFNDVTDEIRLGDANLTIRTTVPSATMTLGALTVTGTGGITIDNAFTSVALNGAISTGTGGLTIDGNGGALTVGAVAISSGGVFDTMTDSVTLSALADVDAATDVTISLITAGGLNLNASSSLTGANDVTISVNQHLILTPYRRAKLTPPLLRRRLSR